MKEDVYLLRISIYKLLEIVKVDEINIKSLIDVYIYFNYELLNYLGLALEFG